MAIARVAPLEGSEPAAAGALADQAAQQQQQQQQQRPQQDEQQHDVPRQQRLSSVGRAFAVLRRVSTMGENAALSKWFDLSPEKSERLAPLEMVLLQVLLVAKAVLLSTGGLALAGLTVWMQSCVQKALIGSSTVETLAVSIGNGSAFELSYELGYCNRPGEGWSATFRGVDLFMVTAACWGYSQASFIFLKSKFEPAIVPVMPIFVALSGSAVFALGALVGRFALGDEYAAVAVATHISSFVVYLPYRVFEIRKGAARNAPTMAGELLEVIIVCTTATASFFLSAFYALLATGLSGLPLIIVSVNGAFCPAPARGIAPDRCSATDLRLLHAGRRLLHAQEICAHDRQGDQA
jgi:hypothetical protein